MQDGASPPPSQEKPSWTGEAWSRDDGMLLNLPVFDECILPFKRLLLRAVRKMEYEVAGCETWYDKDNDKICQLEKMPEDELPPFKANTVGQYFEPGESICKGGDFDDRLVLVLKGTVEKLVGDTPSGGRVVVRTLRRGDCEGLTEFLGVGSNQRTCALRASTSDSEGALVRFMPRDAVQNLLKQLAPYKAVAGTGDDDEGNSESEPEDAKYDDHGRELDMTKRWPHEVAYFEELLLEQIDALPHDAAKELLSIKVAGGSSIELLAMLGQDMFTLDDSLGLKAAGPLPEGIEERYFFDGQVVVKRGLPSDCLIMLLRGEVRGEVPEACAGSCLPIMENLDAMRRHRLLRGSLDGSWLGDAHRRNEAEALAANEGRPSSSATFATTVTSEGDFKEPRAATERIYISTVCRVEKMKKAKERLKKAVEEGQIEEQTKNPDWGWAIDDPECITALGILEKGKLLSPAGLERAESIRIFQEPPEPPPHPEPRAVMRSGSVIGTMGILGIPVVFGGDIVAKGPVLCVVLHRHVLLEALQGTPFAGPRKELGFFIGTGFTAEESVIHLGAPKSSPSEELASGGGLLAAPALPVKRYQDGSPAISPAAWRSPSSPYLERAGSDAAWLLLLNAIRDCMLLWELICDAPNLLLEQLLELFEPRWLLPGDVVIADEEPNSDFLFVVLQGTFIVSLCGSEIDRIGQGAVQGEAQLLGLNDWTRTITVDPKHRGEVMIQILRRERFVDLLLHHPVQKQRMQKMNTDLASAKRADWRMLQNIPLFRNVDHPVFLKRVFKDADILMYTAGDYIAISGEPGSSLVIIVAGACRGEQSQTLFCVDVKAGDWCFQDNYLGNENLRYHDLVVTQPTIVITLHRHTLLGAVVSYPEARPAIIENETWRGTGAQLGNVRIFEGIPVQVLARLLDEASPRYYRQASMVLNKEESVEDDALLLILRGDVQVYVMGIETHTLGPGDTLGLLQYLDLHVPPSPCEYMALTAVDAICIPRGPMKEALADDRYEDTVLKFKRAIKVFSGGEVTDEFGFPIGGGGTFATDCVETSEVFAACSKPFVNSIGSLVEDISFFPGEYLFKQGDVGNAMYCVQAGRIKTTITGVKKPEFIDAGGTVGEMAVLGQTPGHACTAVAETHVWARVLHKRLLDRALKAYPGDVHRMGGAKGGGGFH